MSPQKSHFDFTITIAISLFAIIILYPLLPKISYSQQQQQQLFPFLPPTNTIKDQINNDTQNESAATASDSNSSPSE